MCCFEIVSLAFFSLIANFLVINNDSLCSVKSVKTTNFSVNSVYVGRTMQRFFIYIILTLGYLIVLSFHNVAVSA